MKSKTLGLFVASLLFATPATAVDTTAPTLSVTHSWIQKVGTKYSFKLHLDPNDETGMTLTGPIEYRFKANAATVPSDEPWTTFAWVRERPLVKDLACTSAVFEIRAKDAAGNYSTPAVKYFPAPLAISPEPLLVPKLGNPKSFTGPPIDCRGLFSGNFDGVGAEDILQVDRTTGTVLVRRDNGNGPSNSFMLSANTIEDSAVADIDGDGLLDIAIVASGNLTYYHNDGLDGSNALQFSVGNTGGMATTGISTVKSVVAGDITNEGKPEIIIAGTGDDGMGNTVVKVAWLLNNSMFNLNASNYALAPPDGSAGRMAMGDLTGDGWQDLVMIDATEKRIVVFKNKGNGALGSETDAPTEKPITRDTGDASFPIAAQCLAVGDVTGDGRADVVVGLQDFYGSAGVFRDVQLFQIFHNKGDADLATESFTRELFAGPPAENPTTFSADVVIQDLTGDRFPEIIFTSQFENGLSNQPIGGIRVVKVTAWLDEENDLDSMGTTMFGIPTGASNPNRIATARYGTNTKSDVIVANGDTSTPSKQLIWAFNTFDPAGKPLELTWDGYTQSDATGSTIVGGVRQYEAVVGELVSNIITYANAGYEDISNAFLETTVPANCTVHYADPGFVRVGSVLRWPISLKSGSTAVRRYQLRVISGKVGTSVASSATLKQGTKSLLTTRLPNIKIIESLRLELTAKTTSDTNIGARVHAGEKITYTVKMTNDSPITLTGVKSELKIPVGTLLFNSTTSPLPTYVAPAGAAFGVYSSVHWANLTFTPGEVKEFFLTVDVKSTVAEGGSIVNTATLTRSDNSKQTATFATRVDPPLEITVSADKDDVQPGDTLRYTLTVKNWMATDVADARVVNVLPVGTALVRLGTSDGAGEPVGRGNFNQFPGLLGSTATTMTNPGFDRTTDIMTWNLGTITAGTSYEIQYDVLVNQDIPSSAYVNGVLVNLSVQNTRYNFAGNPVTGTHPVTSLPVLGKRIFAAKPTGGLPAAQAATATPASMLSSALPARSTGLLSTPVTPPRLTLHKDALGDGVTRIAGERIVTVINDIAVTTDGLCDYALTYRNDTGGGTALGVLVKDYVPTHMTFVGHVWHNGSSVSNFFGYRFYDAAGKEMKANGADPFTDSNGNGFYDVGETYTDINGNRKYDGVTAALVRSIDFPAGDLAGNTGGQFIYRTKTTASAGTYITSPAGGMTKFKSGLDFTKIPGYHLTCDNLHFPVNGSPSAVKVLVTGPALFDFPYGVVWSQYELLPNEDAHIAIPFALAGGETLTLSGVKMTLTIPKGYLAKEAKVLDKDGQTRDGTITRNPSTGVTTITFPINASHGGAAHFKVYLDNATKSVLKGPDGAIKTTLTFTPSLSGGYLKGTKVVPIAGVSRLLGSLPVRDTVVAPPPPAAASLRSRAAAPAPIAQLGDSKIFVGRCAPVSVKRGDTFGVTIFVGNLTDLKLGKGSITMNIPAGCDYVDSSTYRFNSLLSDGGDGGGVVFDLPIRSGSKITWNIYSMTPREGGAVTVKFKARADAGTLITDNSCTFDVVNAAGKTAGPMAITVREGNINTQAATIIKSTMAGMGYNMASVPPGFFDVQYLNDLSHTIRIEGADYVQLNNGMGVVQMQGNRVMAIGPPSTIIASTDRIVTPADAPVRIAVGTGASHGVQLTNLPILAPSVIQTANTMLANLNIVANSLVAAGGGNLVAAGGGNMVAAGGGNLIGNDGSTLIGNDGSTLLPIAQLVAAGGGNLIGNDGSTLVAAGGGNLVAAGAGNIVSVGAMFAEDPTMLTTIGEQAAELVAAGAGNLIGMDNGTLVAAGAGNIFAAGTGNLIQNKGVVVLPNK